MTKFDIVEKFIQNKVSSNDENYSIYYLGCYALIDQFGDKYFPLIERLFEMCDFFIGEQTFEELCELAKVNISEYEGSDLKALSLSGISFNVNPTTMTFDVCHRNPKIICSTMGSENLVLIEFAHETLHILKSLVNNTNVSDDGKSVAIRSGLFLDMADICGNELEFDSYNFMLDEVINVFQTVELMKSIKEIDVSQLPVNVLDYYKKLDLDSLIIPYGYDGYLKLIEPLWDCEQFRDTISDGIVIGNLADIEDSFNATVEFDAFGQMSSFLDGLYFLEFDDEERDGAIDFINGVVSSYVKKACTDSNKVKS